MSMSRGMRTEDVPGSRLATIDITYKNEQGFRKFPHIKRIRGDALSGEVISEAVRTFDRPIDLLYIDSVHEYEHTKRSIDVYANTLNPRYVILDDIHLTDSIEVLWGELVEQFKERACDASEIVRRRSAGFGVIKWREYNFRTTLNVIPEISHK